MQTLILPNAEAVAAAKARASHVNERLADLTKIVRVEYGGDSCHHEDDSDSTGRLYHGQISIAWQPEITLDDREDEPLDVQLIDALKEVAHEYELLAGRVEIQLTGNPDELGPPTDVWLIDRSGDSDPELAYRAESRRAAEVWKREWDRKPTGLSVVLTPAGECPAVKGGAV